MILARLLESPHLLDLGLSLSEATRWWHLHPCQHLHREKRHPAHFLNMLCRDYKEIGGKPLALRSLNLGHYMFVLREGYAGRNRPVFPEEHENGAHLDDLADLSQLKELSLDLFDDHGFKLIPNFNVESVYHHDADAFDSVNLAGHEGTNGDEYWTGGKRMWWPTAPGPLLNLQKLSVRMPNTWVVRWAKGLVHKGAPLTQLQINQAVDLPKRWHYARERLYGREYMCETSWMDLLDCRPRDLLVCGRGWLCHQPGKWDALIACNSIQNLAIASEIKQNELFYVLRCMPQLEGLWIMESLFRPDERHGGYYGIGTGGALADIRDRMRESAQFVQRIAYHATGLKILRLCSSAWRIERRAFEISMHPLDRMENETEIPDLFKISVPYTFDTAHAAKYWVPDRRRSMADELE